MGTYGMRTSTLFFLLVALIVGLVQHGTPAHAEPSLILNEFNTVKGSEYLKGGNSDAYFGRVEGNGDNWIELVVVGDHADIRGYELLWWEDDGDGNGTAIWDPSRASFNESQGKITFANNALWSDLRSGTIITISDKQIVDTVYEDATPVSFDLSTDTSYNPLAGDWWIHVSSRQEAGESNPLVTTMNNIDGDPAGAFSVGNNDWELRITDGTTTVFGPIGEAIIGENGTFGGLGVDEVGKLEADPSASVTVDDFNDGSSSTFGSPNVWGSGDNEQDFSGLRAAVPEPTAAVMLAAVLAAIAFIRRR
ncbi:MAG: hypothetical protein JW888_04640 [Pirellulales bacterium]|nr:hypothetical protein [Pirellulales bacterium]